MTKINISEFAVVFPIALVCLVVCSCSNQPIISSIEGVGDYYCFCTLDPDYTYQQVLVGKTVPESFPIDISDAMVTIESTNQSVLFHYIGKGFYRDTEQPLKLVPGETYYLTVRLADGNLMTGKATMPDSFQILSPTKTDTVDHYLSTRLDTMLLPRVSWTRSAGSRYYQVELHFNNTNIRGSNNVFTHRTSVFFPELHYDNRDPMRGQITGEEIFDAELKITAFDSTKYEYLWFGRDFIPRYSDFTSQEAEIVNNESHTIHNMTNVTGGLGTFKTKSIIKQNVIIRVHKNWP
ncbi:DUF4249 family protein [candidate division KSB1 bacterium]|nr:DUF4249 family protein [candidate division KSB1 bacterium]